MIFRFSKAEIRYAGSFCEFAGGNLKAAWKCSPIRPERAYARQPFFRRESAVRARGCRP
jgi:hypothetical protein